MQVNFEVKGKVKAKQSFKIGQNGFKYTPADVIEYANYVRMSFINKYPAWDITQFADKPLTSEITVYMPIPKSYSKKKQEQALTGQVSPIVKPDCDNIAKNINDALNGVVYPDDKQIVKLVVKKLYSENERVEIFITDERSR